MPRLENPHEHKPVHTLHQSPLRPIHRIVLQRLLAESLLAVEFHRVRNGFVARSMSAIFHPAWFDSFAHFLSSLQAQGILGISYHYCSKERR